MWFYLKHEALLLIDGILLFAKRILDLVAKNQVFGRKFISLERSTVSLSDNQGYNCTYENKTYHWPLGETMFKNLVKV